MLGAPVYKALKGLRYHCPRRFYIMAQWGGPLVIHLFRSPTYGFLAGAIFVQRSRA